MSGWPLSTFETHISLSYGNPGAAFYLPKSTNSKWIFIKNHSGIPLKALGHNILEYNKSLLSSEESLNLPSRTLQEKYLKTNYSDIWVPSDILGPWIKESGLIISSYNIHDPLRGKCLTECQFWETENRNLSHKMLAFVSGNNFSEISLAFMKRYNTTIYCGDNIEKKLKIPQISEINNSIFTSQTPIRQISNSPIYNGKYMLIRNYTSSALLELICNSSKHSSAKNTSISANPLITIKSNDTGNYEHSDIIFDFFNKNQLVVINRKGIWTLWDIEGRYRTIEQSSSNVSIDMEENDGWWKIDWASSPRSIIVSGRRTVELFDFRTPSNQLLLYSLPDSHNILDFHKTHKNLNYFFILSTSEVYWLDERQPKKPLLSWKHYRNYDPSLKVIVDDSLGNFNLILYSNINPIKSCYQFKLKGDLSFSSIPPYELPNSQNTSMTSIICPLNELNTHKNESNLENQSQFIKLYSLGSEGNITSQIYYYAYQDTNYTFHNHKSIYSIVEKSSKYINNSSEDEDGSIEKNESKNEIFYDNNFKLVDFSKLYHEIINLNNFVFRKFFSKDLSNETNDILNNHKIFTLGDIYTPSKQSSFDEIFSYLKEMFQEYTKKGWKIYSLVPKSQKLLGFIDFVFEFNDWNFKYIYNTLIKHWLDNQNCSNSVEYDKEYLYELFKDISIELGLSSIGLEPPELFTESKKEFLTTLLDDNSFKISQSNIESENPYSLLDEWKIGVNPDLYKWQTFEKNSINNIELFYEKTLLEPPKPTPAPHIITSQITMNNLNNQKFSSQPFKKSKNKRQAGF
ncbi:hypothetical protein PCK1_001955 [Pneumocystis canis]|nr:hypothetical protein PCK1_001955 [Pneumocystis canis]